MIVSVQKSTLNGVIKAPASKSYTHRAIIVASLGKDECKLSRPLLSADTKSTIAACKAFGAKIEEIKNSEINNSELLDSEKDDFSIIVNGFNGKPNVPKSEIDIGNSGTTLRIMTALSGLIEEEIILAGDDSIQTRPNIPLLKTLTEMGAEAYSIKNNGCAPLAVKGKIKPGAVTIDGGISSQFISALLLACPLLDGDSVVKIDGELKSKPYVDITLEIAEKAGVCIQEKYSKEGKNEENECKKNENEESENENAGIFYEIKGNQKYNLGDYIIPGDFSSASYLLAAGAIIPNAEITVAGLFPSAQGDRAIVEILEKMGADISWNKENGIVHVQNKSGKRLKGIVWDAGETPDLVPTLAVLGAFADGEMKIINAEHVRFKETDRLKAMTTELQKIGADIEETKDGLIISGENSKGKMKGAKLHGWDDHRIVMSLFVAGMMIGGVEIDTSESVRISFPEFFEEMRKLGAVFEKMN
jgi:5-enolpyruvylshikimate-3-phosphate synthase